MLIYTVTSRGLCCPDALSILHFAKLSDTSMDKIPPFVPELSPPLRNCALSDNKTKCNQTLSQREGKRWFYKLLTMQLHKE